MRISWGASLTVPGADRIYDAVRAGNAFSRGQTRGAVAAQYGHVQLFNPVGSAVRILIRDIGIGSTVNASVFLSEFNTELTNSVGTGFNLLQGSDAAVGVIRDQTNATQLGTSYNQHFVLADQQGHINPSWIKELGAGEGFVVFHTTVNVTFTVNFTWIEL